MSSLNTINKTIYFPNLNGLRFIAALLIIIHHVEQFKNIFGLHSYWSSYHIWILGKLGVTLFFVLSGFLITYLLLEEKIQFGSISIKEFYIRRVLRIWPLYYLITFAGFFILPHISFFNLPELYSVYENNFYTKLLLFLFLLPNICLNFFSPVAYASQLWSVGVEEQFYLFWPWLLNKSQKPLKVLLLILIFFTVGTHLENILPYLNFKGNSIIIQLSTTISNIFSLLRIGCMALGGITAYLLFKEKEFTIKFLCSLPAQIITYFLMGLIFIKGINISQEIWSVFFAILILNLAGNPNTILKLENNVFNFLGKISYGLYMLHPIAIVISIKLILFLNIQKNHYFNIFIYATSILVTVLLATLSYYYFEKRFLRLKNKFAIVKSFS